MLLDSINDVLLKIPLINRIYYWNSAGLKRRYYIQLARWGRLKPIAFVLWLCTFKCNLHCPYCEASAGEPDSDELTRAEAFTMLDDLRLSGARKVLISGGEPLMRPDIIQVLNYAVGKGLKPGLISNGFRVEEMWPELKKNSYFLYQTSLDGIPAYHDHIRGHDGAFRAAMTSLKLMASIQVPLRIINTVVHPGNLSQLDEMMGYVKNSAAHCWFLTPPAQVGRATGGEFALNSAQLKTIVEFITRNRKLFPVDFSESHAYIGCFDRICLGKPFFCAAGLTRASIMPNGDVLGCNQVYNSAFSEGNIRINPFSYIWKNGFAQFRNRKFSEDCQSCQYLKSCQGGCWVEWNRRKSCMKDLWNQTESAE